jgi:hypothetical protein
MCKQTNKQILRFIQAISVDCVGCLCVRVGCCNSPGVQRSDSRNMSESYWTKRRKLFSNVHKQLATFADASRG